MNSALKKITGGMPKCDLPLLILIFFMLFAPPIVPEINTALFAAAVVGIILLVRHRKEIIPVVKESGMMIFTVLMIAFFVYLAIVTLVNFAAGERVQLMHYIVLWYRFFLIVPVLLICCLYICIHSKNHGYSPYDLGMQFVYATMIQFFLALVALMIPAVKDWFVDVIYANTGAYYLGIPWLMLRRGFGFTNSFVDSFGLGMGIIAALPLFFIKKNRLKILYFIPCAIFISLVNVRTGLIMSAIGLVFALPVIIKTLIKEKFRLVASAAGAVLVLVGFFALVQVRNPVTISWIFGDLASFTGQDTQSPPQQDNSPADTPETPSPDAGEQDPNLGDPTHLTADNLFSKDFWNFPTGTSLIFGTGHTVYEAEGYAHSDVGYVNDLWMSGIVGSLLLYIAFAYVLWSAFKGSAGNIKCLVLFFAIAIVIFQVKANAFMFNAGINTILPLCFYIRLYNTRQKEERL